MTDVGHRHFHEELSNLKVRLLTMSGEAEAALGLAVEALLERDTDKARQVITGDHVINAMEVELEEQCISLLALQQPMARDLRMLTSALKIANDLERVGDHAVNIAQSADRLSQSRPITPEPEIVEMARLTRLMLSDALEAFIRGDADAGLVRGGPTLDFLDMTLWIMTHPVLRHTARVRVLMTFVADALTEHAALFAGEHAAAPRRSRARR